MSGYAPLSYATISGWSALTGHRPTPAEVTGLLALDAVMRNPHPPKKADAAAAPEVMPAWPEKKR